MDDCGFVTLDDTAIIGFMSWDPRNMPVSVEIGHNCIIEKLKGCGKGKEQLLLGLKTIASMKPSKIIVKTGNIEFFKPAQKMYLSVGFKLKSIIKKDDNLVPEVMEYELLL
jgi:predicted GNAT family N-acyltransferase